MWYQEKGAQLGGRGGGGSNGEEGGGRRAMPGVAPVLSWALTQQESELWRGGRQAGRQATGRMNSERQKGSSKEPFTFLPVRSQAEWHVEKRAANRGQCSEESGLIDQEETWCPRPGSDKPRQWSRKMGQEGRWGFLGWN